MRFFNTAGPVSCADHYCLPPLERFNLEEVLFLIAQKKYFVLHAPRQTGKTSCLLALMAYLNQSDQYRCLYINVEAAQTARENIEQGIDSVLRELASRAEVHLNESFPESILDRMLTGEGYGTALNRCLTAWTRKLDKPLVLLIDEIDTLVGDTLISVLRQIRSGYDKRPDHFPQSIVLCGVRDVRDYRIHSDTEKEIITGGSAFNIKAESLRLGDFTADEVRRLYDCHTADTGQQFESDVLPRIWELTRGQPWLVNALGYEVCFKTKAVREQSVPITSDMIDTAKEDLILRRETHLDQLVDKLNEDRVRRIIEPVLLGRDLGNIRQDDIQYLIDLGLLTRTPEGLEIANPIYREIIPRELTLVTQYNLEPRFQPAWYLLPDGLLDMNGLLTAFQSFFRENAEHWVERFDYREAGPQLLLQAFLQRVINSGGDIHREYGLGRGRTDLFVVWRHENGRQKVVLELKLLHRSLKKTMAEGLTQTAAYMDRCGAEEGHLILFDRRPDKTWEEKIFRREEDVGRKQIVVWGM